MAITWPRTHDLRQDPRGGETRDPGLCSLNDWGFIFLQSFHQGSTTGLMVGFLEGFWAAGWQPTALKGLGAVGWQLTRPMVGLDSFSASCGSSVWRFRRLAMVYPPGPPGPPGPASWTVGMARNMRWAAWAARAPVLHGGVSTSNRICCCYLLFSVAITQYFFWLL